jgi:putative membrane protein
MRGFVLRALANAVAIWIATAIVPGVDLGESDLGAKVLTLVLVGALFGIVNAILKPILTVITLPLYVLTLGLFALVVNALLLWLTGALAGALDLAFDVAGFWAALGGGIVVAIVSVGFNLLRND